MEDYEKLYRLGSGAQGKILKVRNKKSGVCYACKMILCRDNYEMNFALKEIKMLMELKHPHIVAYHDFFIHKDRHDDLYVCLVMEFCDLGDLSEKIRDAKRRHMKFDEGRIIKWQIQMCSALQFIHQNDILHRDLKPSNVLFTAKDDIKIGDFGLSTFNTDRRTVVGTPFYLSPELLLHQKYNMKIDLWGLGIILMELCTLKERPVNSQVLNNAKVLDEIEADILKCGYTALMGRLCKKLLDKRPQRRPNALEVLSQLCPPEELLSLGIVSVDNPKEAPLCDLCQERPAAFQCDECDHEVYCEGCDSKQHRAERRAFHKRFPLFVANHRGGLLMVDITEKLCHLCGQYLARSYCNDCEEYLCDSCDEMRHKNAKRAAHSRIRTSNEEILSLDGAPMVVEPKKPSAVGFAPHPPPPALQGVVITAVPSLRTAGTAVITPTICNNVGLNIPVPPSYTQPIRPVHPPTHPNAMALGNVGIKSFPQQSHQIPLPPSIASARYRINLNANANRDFEPQPRNGGANPVPSGKPFQRNRVNQAQMAPLLPVTTDHPTAETLKSRPIDNKENFIPFPPMLPSDLATGTSSTSSTLTSMEFLLTPKPITNEDELSPKPNGDSQGTLFMSNLISPIPIMGEEVPEEEGHYKLAESQGGHRCVGGEGGGDEALPSVVGPLQYSPTPQEESPKPVDFSANNNSNEGVYVPTDYLTIMEAVRNVKIGEKIFILPGVYREPLVIDKEVYLVGLGTLPAHADDDLPTLKGCDEAGEEIDLPYVLIQVVGKSTITITAEVGKLENVVIHQQAKSPGNAKNYKEHKFVGVDFRRGSFQLEYCDISSRCGACVAIHGLNTNPTLRNCYIHDGSQAGVYIYDHGQGQLHELEISRQDCTGILLKRSANPTITMCKIISGQETGIFICHDSGGKISENQISDNKGSGVIIKGEGKCTLTKNQIFGNLQAGIFCCDHVRATISENNIHGNGKAGILLKTYSCPNVVGNKIHSGKEAGIYVFDSGEGLIEHNQIYENQNAGILVTTKGNPRIRQNRISANLFEGIWVCKQGQAFVQGNDLRGNQKGPLNVEEDCLDAVTMVENVIVM